MSQSKLRDIGESELDRTIWRYLTFKKYQSLIDFRGIWFSKLNILADEFEGAMPNKADAALRNQFEPYKKHLAPELHHQLDEANSRNVSDGRELTLVSCWFCSEEESRRMWEEYASVEHGVAIKSTIRKLLSSVHAHSSFSSAGMVKYVDLSTHGMTNYEANQAQERAFLKSTKFAHEREFRIATFNAKGPHCVKAGGMRLDAEEYEGAKMNNFDKPGLTIYADLNKLITATVLAPKVSEEFATDIRAIATNSGVGLPVLPSALAW